MGLLAYGASPPRAPSPASSPADGPARWRAVVIAAALACSVLACATVRSAVPAQAALLPSAGKDGGAEAEMSAPSDPCQAVGGIGDASRPGFCCAKECGSCGGKDCGGQPGGEDKCCTSGIEQSGRSCGSDRAPCAMQDAALDTGAGAGCLFARTEALKCLTERKVYVVGGSVTMHSCAAMAYMLGGKKLSKAEYLQKYGDGAPDRGNHKVQLPQQGIVVECVAKKLAADITAWLKDLPESDRDEATIFVQPGPTWYFHCSEGTFCPEKKTTKALLKLHERYKKPTEPQQEADLARSISEIIDHDLGELSKALGDTCKHASCFVGDNLPDPKQLSDDAAKDFKVVVTRHMLQTVRRIFDDADNVQFVDIASAVQAKLQSESLQSHYSNYGNVLIYNRFLASACAPRTHACAKGARAAPPDTCRKAQCRDKKNKPITQWVDMTTAPCDQGES